MRALLLVPRHGMAMWLQERLRAPPAMLDARTCHSVEHAVQDLDCRWYDVALIDADVQPWDDVVERLRGAHADLPIVWWVAPGTATSAFHDLGCEVAVKHVDTDEVLALRLAAASARAHPRPPRSMDVALATSLRRVRLAREAVHDAKARWETAPDPVAAQAALSHASDALDDLLEHGKPWFRTYSLADLLDGVGRMTHRSVRRPADDAQVTINRHPMETGLALLFRLVDPDRNGIQLDWTEDDETIHIHAPTLPRQSIQVAHPAGWRMVQTNLAQSMAVVEEAPGQLNIVVPRA